MSAEQAEVNSWLRRCLGPTTPAPSRCRGLGRGRDPRVWECSLNDTRVVLKVYSSEGDDYSCLGPVDAARKHALALQEFPALGVPAPRCLGFAADGEEAAIVMECIEAEPLTAQARCEAARLLARLHATPLTALTPELAVLVTRSTPNRDRLGHAPDEPPRHETTLQHGDYFSVNLACGAQGVRVLDWDLLACGDPMWDLAFLLAADREGVDAEATMQAYAEVRPIDTARLNWHLACFEAYWARREG
jgi:aminoglycoside phosphotransferase (APT) family kinase protein